jgi:hypothetical protein
MPGLWESTRRTMIGNSFHVGVIKQIFRTWLLGLKKFDSTLGFPGEGPTWEEKRRRMRSASGLGPAGRSIQKQPREKRPVATNRVVRVLTEKERAAHALFGGQPSSRSLTQAPVPSASGRREAAWKTVLPPTQQRCGGVSMLSVLPVEEWGTVKRAILAPRAGKGKLAVPTALGYRGAADAMVRDLVLSSRADDTWKAYRAWMEVFWAFLDRFEVSAEPAPEHWEDWMEVLIIAIAVLAQCYSLGTINVLASAVSAHMQDYGMQSPFSSRLFAMLMRGLPRYMGVGKKKKPPVEAWHVARIVTMERPKGTTILMFLQALTVLLVGWHLFTRSQDFPEFQVCDFIQLDSGMRVLVRYAKNDQKGITRAPVLAFAEDPRACPVRTYRRCAAALNLRVQPGCNKVEGEPQRCTVCPPAFPSVTRHRGVAGRPMPKARVTEMLRMLFLQLASLGALTEQEARAISSKSLRCGGVTQAAASCIRDGVVQAHGGWLHRQSLIHYDLMRKNEQSDVSRALGEAVQAFF